MPTSDDASAFIAGNTKDILKHIQFCARSTVITEYIYLIRVSTSWPIITEPITGLPPGLFDLRHYLI